MKIIWWRVAMLAVIVAGAGYGSWSVFTGHNRSQPGIVEPSPSPEAGSKTAGPAPGDLHDLLLVAASTSDATPEPTPDGTSEEPRVRASTRRSQPPAASVAPSTRPVPSKNPFGKLPGSGPISDICQNGAC